MIVLEIIVDEGYEKLDPVVLPARKVHETPRILLADAYTAGAERFVSPKANEKSTYYITFRKLLETIVDGPYRKGDTRMVYVGLQRILEKLFYKPVTHEEIDEAKRFLATAKVTTKGLTEFWFPEHLWRTSVHG